MRTGVEREGAAVFLALDDGARGAVTVRCPVSAASALAALLRAAASSEDEDFDARVGLEGELSVRAPKEEHPP